MKAKSFNENWDGIQRKQMEEVEQVKEGMERISTPNREFHPASKKSQARWKVEDTKKSGETWKTANGNFGGKNQHNQVSYFKDETKAKAWASGKTKYKKIPHFKDDPYVDESINTEVEQVAEVMNPQEKAKQDAIDARIRKLNTDIAVDQIKEILRSYTHDKKQREMILAAIKQIKEEAAEKRNNTINEAADLGRYWTDLDDMATNIQKETKNVAWVGKFDVHSYLLQIVGSLRQKHAQQRDFLQGLIYSLEAVHKKTSAPSKHGNMEILNDLSTVIRELKKYQK